MSLNLRQYLHQQVSILGLEEGRILLHQSSYQVCRWVSCTAAYQAAACSPTPSALFSGACTSTYLCTVSRVCLIKYFVTSNVASSRRHAWWSGLLMGRANVVGAWLPMQPNRWTNRRGQMVSISEFEIDKHLSRSPGFSDTHCAEQWPLNSTVWHSMFSGLRAVPVLLHRTQLSSAICLLC